VQICFLLRGCRGTGHPCPLFPSRRPPLKNLLFTSLAQSRPQFLFWTIAGNVTQTLFDGFTLEQRQRAAEAGWDQVAEQYRSTVIIAFQNVADSLQAIEFDANP